jgi:ADP-ribose pyrophosphatase
MEHHRGGSDRRQEYREMVASHPDLFSNPPDAAFEIVLDERDIKRAEDHMAGLLTAAGAPAEWANVGVAFRDQYVLILRDAVRFSDGSLGTYIRMVNTTPEVLGVVTLPVWQGQVLLIRHFRHATRRWHLEIPRGFGSTANKQQDALRELSEEIGASGISLTELGEMYPDAGADNSRVALFLAEVEAYGKPESAEGINEIRPVAISEFERMIRDGVLDDGFLLAAYARAKARRLL